MYCKECGKEIVNDAKFCPYCGTSQEDNISNTVNTKTVKGKDEVPNISETESKLLIRMKIIRPYYIGWSVLNIILFFIGKIVLSHNITTDSWSYGSYDQEKFHFFPFSGSHIYDYDFSEFVTYVFILPIVVYLLFLIFKKLDN